MYSLLLQQEKQITFSNYSSTAFVLQDFDKSSKSLDKVSVYYYCACVCINPMLFQK